MKTYLTTFLFTFSYLTYAQTQPIVNAYTAKIDSLHRLLTKQPTTDTLQVIRLNALARLCFVDLQFKRGLLAAKQARMLAKQIRYANGEGHYLRTLATFTYNTNLSGYYDFMTKWFYADSYRQEPIVNSYVFYPSGIDYTKANSQLVTALTYFIKEQDAELVAGILYMISVTYRNLNEFEESLPYLDRSVQAFLNAKKPTAAYYVLALKSLLLQRNKRTIEAKQAERAVSRFLATHENTRPAALIARQLRIFYTNENRLVLAFESASKTNAFLERIDEEYLRPFILEDLGYFYTNLKAPKKALDYFKTAAVLIGKTNNQPRLAWMYNKVAFSLITLKRFEEAKGYITKAKHINDTKPESFETKVNLAQYYDATGQILMGQGHYWEAIPNFFNALKMDSTVGGAGLRFYFNFYIAQCYQKLGNLPASIDYGLRSYKEALLNNSGGNGREITLKLSQLLFENYEQLGQQKAAHQYLKHYYALQKAMDDQNATNRLTDLQIQLIVQKGEQEKNRLEQARLMKEKENQNQRWWLFSIAVALFSAIILLALLYRNNQHKQKANALLNRQKEEIDRQRNKAEKALTELKASQAQLIQKEKLASLGELTAGIAHEIQNPLNFVNNFSEVSSELVDELKEGPFQKLPELEKTYAEEILGDLSSNLQKINHHGGRASSIVKGMLEHSRAESGEKRLTDLNALADEYLKIAYHGLRAKDKDFNCELITQFDSSLKPIGVAPQEIGRVLLNLYNNAFYAVSERARQTPTPNYKPTVEVSTKQETDQLIIRVRDNGTGIPESVRTKIFQPFFTTKSTGEGTGLGLSLAYDIITKGHGGTLSLDSAITQGAQFVIKLPISSAGLKILA